MNFLKQKVKVATHNGTFHADDLFACATLSIWAENNGKRLEIIRTRDQEEIEKADIVLDVGFIYDAEKKRFDHHQKGGAGTHENGIPLASFGLIWKSFGEEITTKEIAEILEERLVIPIDARDNGVNTTDPNTKIVDYRMSESLFSFNPTWIEGEEKSYEQFKKALEIAVEILKREIEWEKAHLEGARLTREAIESQGNPEILILENRVDSESEVAQHKTIKFVASKSKGSDNWSVVAARDDLEDYHSNRASFPATWRGLSDGELEKASGIKGTIFCHSGGWFAKALTKEAALEMAKRALGN